MVPYFILGVGIIIAFRLISEIAFFSSIVGEFWGVITPFLAGLVVAYILNLPCSSIQKLLLKTNVKFIQKRSRIISVFILLLIVIMIIILVLNLLVPAISRNITMFIAEFQNYEETFRQWMYTIDNWDLPDFLPEINEELIMSTVLDFVQGFNFDALFSSIVSGFGSAFSALFNTILTIVSSIYFLIEKDRFKVFIQRLIKAVSKERTNDTVMKYAKKLNFNFHQYIFTQTIDGIILGSIMVVVLWLFGSPYALILGLILGVLNYIPYFGSIVGTALAVIVVAFTQGIPIAAIAAIVMFIIQQIDGNVIQPKLMGGSFSISPLLIIISVTIGGAYGGILGMLVAIPIVAIFQDILFEYIEYREEKKLAEPVAEENDFMNRDIWL